jgi:hypothetical protein
MHAHHICKNKWCVEPAHIMWMPKKAHSQSAGYARVAEEATVTQHGFPFRNAQGKFVPLLPHFHLNVQPQHGARVYQPKLVADVWQQGHADVVQAAATLKGAVGLKGAMLAPMGA